MQRRGAGRIAQAAASGRIIHAGVNVIRGDARLNSRFDPFGLPPWRYDADFHGLMGSLLRTLPLRAPTELGESALKRIVEVTGGVASAIFRLTADLAVEGIASGAERITPTDIFERRVASPTPELAS